MDVDTRLPLCRVPLAPPHTLVLADATFMAFPAAQLADAPPEYLTTTGTHLQLRERGCELRDSFESGTMAAGLAQLLAHKDWDEWQAAMDHAVVDQEALATWLAAYQAWWEGVERRRATAAAWTAGVDDASADKDQTNEQPSAA